MTVVEPAADQQQRLEALDTARSFIVQAPAGSGKTELLIQRFLALLARVDRPEAVVAITFTRKAAAEMRHRIVAALGSAAGPRPATPHEAHTWKLAREAVARNDRLDWRLAEHPARLRIQTIDSLCAMLVRRMPWVSRMGAAPRPVDDAGHLYARAARRTVSMLDADGAPPAVSGAVAELLAHLDNHFGRVERLLSIMLGSRDQWMRHVAHRGHRRALRESPALGGPTSEDDTATSGDAPAPRAPEALRAHLEASLEEVIESALERVRNGFPERFKEETVALARFAASNLRASNRASAIDACQEMTGFPGSDAESLPCWTGIAEMFLTGRGTRRQALNVNHGFPPTDDGRAAKERLARIDLDPETAESLHELRTLPPPRFDERQWDVLNALMLLLPVAVEQLRIVFQEEGCVDFTEIGIGARAALGPDEAPTDLARSLDDRIMHLLIDEFQDTSQSQYGLLTRLIRDWRPDDGRTLFLVGDPMQSIYGFREAEVGLFLQARKNGVGAVRPVPLALSVNFRSHPPVVDWVNRVLREAFPLSEDFLSGAVTYEPSEAFKADDSDSCVRFHPFLDRDQEAEAERVVEIITEARARRPEETIAVLVHARSHLAGIVSALRRHGVRFRAVEIDALGDRPVVRDLLALTRALLHPGDRVAWLALLRAPWCGLTLTDLEALAGGDVPSAVWDLLQDPARRERLSPDARSRIDRILPVLADAFALRARLPVRRLVEGVWSALGGQACLETRTEREDASAFLDLLDRVQDGLGIPDERAFADDVARLFAPSDIEAAGDVQLLTVHRAKGLEFDTVILPGLGRLPRSEDPRLLMWHEYARGGRPRLLLAPIRATGSEKDPLYAYLAHIETQKRENERTRLLYVAATRARKCLHLLGHAVPDPEKESLKTPGSRTLLARIWHAVEPEFMEALKDYEGKDPERDTATAKLRGVPLRRLVAGWTPDPPPEDIDFKPLYDPTDPDGDESGHPTFEWVTELQRRVGIVVHQMLQRMYAPDLLDFDDYRLRTALRLEGLAGEKLDEAVSRALAALANTVADERGRWILSRHPHDERELALTTVLDGRIQRYVVDRTFVFEGRRWIIDYKTSAHTGGDLEGFLNNEQQRYRSQLEGYAGVLQSLESGPVNLGLYFPMLQGWRTWTYPGNPH
ncbi:MAG: AAA family ATPase [Gemmatimonadetes bacterium]|nr:AAA family ATPase [Gemmatimonadota bacterium]MYG83868.1 AAA family ATPase [Gemmatimonadota bacterium]MYJ88538.1 AAA family ATPase [Gemmatimonadota bacterium]